VVRDVPKKESFGAGSNPRNSTALESSSRFESLKIRLL
jgi:hypothetical protein